MNASASAFWPRIINQHEPRFGEVTSVSRESRGVMLQDKLNTNCAGSLAPSMLRAHPQPHAILQPWELIVGPAPQMYGPHMPLYPSYGQLLTVGMHAPPLGNASSSSVAPQRRPTSPAAAIHHLGDSVPSSSFLHMPEVTISALLGTHERNLSHRFSFGHAHKAGTGLLKRLIPPAPAPQLSLSPSASSSNSFGYTHSGVGTASSLNAFGLVAKQRICRVRLPDEIGSIELHDSEILASLWRRCSIEVLQDVMPPLPPDIQTRPSVPEDSVSKQKLPQTIEIYLPNDWHEVRAQLLELSIAKLGIDHHHPQQIWSGPPTFVAPTTRANLFSSLAVPCSVQSRFASIALPKTQCGELLADWTNTHLGMRSLRRARSISADYPSQPLPETVYRPADFQPPNPGIIPETPPLVVPELAKLSDRDARHASRMSLKDPSAELGITTNIQSESSPRQHAAQLLFRSSASLASKHAAESLPLAAREDMDRGKFAEESMPEKLWGNKFGARHTGTIPEVNVVKRTEFKERDFIAEASPSPRPVSGNGYNSGNSEASQESASGSDSRFSNASEAEEARCRRELVAIGATASPVRLRYREGHPCDVVSESDDVISNRSDEAAFTSARPTRTSNVPTAVPFFLHTASLSNASTDQSASNSALDAAAGPFVMPAMQTSPMQPVRTGSTTTKSDLNPEASAFAPFSVKAGIREASQSTAVNAGDSGTKAELEINQHRVSLKDFRFPATSVSLPTAVPKQFQISSLTRQLPHFGSIGRNTKRKTALLNCIASADGSSDGDTEKVAADWMLPSREARQPVPNFDRFDAIWTRSCQKSLPDTPVSLSSVPSQLHGAQQKYDQEYAAEASSYACPIRLSAERSILKEAHAQDFSSNGLQIPHKEESIARHLRMFEVLLDRTLDILRADVQIFRPEAFIQGAETPNDHRFKRKSVDAIQGGLPSGTRSIRPQDVHNDHPSARQADQQHEIRPTVQGAIREIQEVLAQLQTEASKSLGTILELLNLRLSSNVVTDPLQSNNAGIGFLEEHHAMLRHRQAEHIDADYIVSEVSSSLTTQLAQIVTHHAEEHRLMLANVESNILRSFHRSQRTTACETREALQASIADAVTKLSVPLTSQTQYASQAPISDNGTTRAGSQFQGNEGFNEAVSSALQALHVALVTRHDAHTDALRDLRQELLLWREEKNVQVEHFERAERRYDEEVSNLKEALRKEEQKLNVQDAIARQADTLKAQHTQREAELCKEINDLRMVLAAMQSEITTLNEQARVSEEELHALQTSLDAAHKATPDLEEVHRNELPSTHRSEAATEERSKIAEVRTLCQNPPSGAPIDDKYNELKSVLSNIQSEMQTFVNAQQQRIKVFSNPTPRLAHIQHDRSEDGKSVRDLAKDNALLIRTIFASIWKDQHSDDIRLLEDFTPGLADADLAFEGCIPFENGYLTIDANGHLARTADGFRNLAEEALELDKDCRVASDGSGWYFATQSK